MAFIYEKRHNYEQDRYMAYYGWQLVWGRRYLGHNEYETGSGGAVTFLLPRVK